MDAALTPLDALFLARACELAARGIGSTAPNPPVGAVVVRAGRIVGEGYHHRAGEPHAERLALRDAGERARGATLYVSLEPCAHVGRTPPCTHAIVEAGIVRIVAGAADPTGHGGAAELHDRGVAYLAAHSAAAGELIEVFARSASLDRPYVAIKMAAGLDGGIAAAPQTREQLTGEAMRRRVRELRAAYDAVMVGAQTVRVDDPLLIVRPPHDRLRPYRRVVLCGRNAIPERSRVLDAVEGYAPTAVVAPAALLPRLEGLRGRAEIVPVGDAQRTDLDLREVLAALRARGITSLLCEGGPRLAGALIAAGEADRFYWAIAPVLRGPDAVRALCADGPRLRGVRLRFERAESVGADLLLTGRFADV